MVSGQFLGTCAPLGRLGEAPQWMQGTCGVLVGFAGGPSLAPNKDPRPLPSGSLNERVWEILAAIGEDQKEAIFQSAG